MKEVRSVNAAPTASQFNAKDGTPILIDRTNKIAYALDSTGAAFNLATVSISASIDDTPVNGVIDHAISSNWAYDHVAAADPHTGYRLESDNHTHQSSGAQAGQLDHGLALTGLTDDDHTQYLLASQATDRTTFTANWTDLTDGGGTTLHTHTSGSITDFTEAAQDAVGAMVDASLTYVDGTPLLQRAALTGDVTASAGSNATTLATVNANVGSFGSATQVGTFTVNGKGLITAASNATIAIASTAVTDFSEAAQDAVGGILTDSTTVDFTYNDGAGTITASVLTVPIANEATDTTCFLLFATAASGDLAPKTNANMTFNSNTGVVTFASSVLTTTDINGGTVDGAVIGGSSAAAITGTTITANTGFMPDADDGAYLGQAGTAFSDLFLAEGGVINWDSGDVTITQTGNVLAFAGASTGYTFDALVDISGASAGQIKFPASQNASADANTLDDYEEGTWTPALSFGGASVGITYGTQTGTYTKVGNRVAFEFYIALSSKGSSVGGAVVGGLPFTVQAKYGACAFRPDSMAATAATMLVGQIDASSTQIEVMRFAAGAIANADNADFNNNSGLIGSGVYAI